MKVDAGCRPLFYTNCVLDIYKLVSKKKFNIRNNFGAYLQRAIEYRFFSSSVECSGFCFTLIRNRAYIFNEHLKCLMWRFADYGSPTNVMWPTVKGRQPFVTYKNKRQLKWIRLLHLLGLYKQQLKRKGANSGSKTWLAHVSRYLYTHTKIYIYTGEV